MNLNSQDIETTGVESPPKVPEGIEKDAFYAIHFFKEHINGILNLFDNNTARNFQTIYDAISCLDDKLEMKFDSAPPMLQIADFANKCARQTIDFFNVFSHAVAEGIRSHAALPLYWLESLRTKPENKASLPRNGGTYEVGVRFDKESTTDGGEEFQQSIAALLLHRADIVSHTGHKALDPEFETFFNAESRASIVDSARRLLHQPFWQHIPHLSHIIRPTSKPWFYSHDQSLRIFKGKPVRRERPIDQERVRLFRSSTDHKSGYYLDLSAEELLNLPPSLLGNLLTPSDETHSTINSQSLGWIPIKSPQDLWDKEKEPPAYSISSGIYESDNKLLQEVAANGNSITHLAYDFGEIKLQVSHVAENGASLKVGAFDVAYALQFGRKQDEPLAASTSPFTEIRPPYWKKVLPSNWKIKRAARNEKYLRQLLDAFALSDVRIGFDDLTPEDTKGITQLTKELNSSFVTPKREKLKKYLKTHSSTSAPMDDASIEQFLKIFTPELTVQDVFALGTKIIEGNTAINQLPIRKEGELVHPSVPDLISDQKEIFNQEWIDLYQTDKALSKFGLNIYNSYKLLTMNWREIPFLGAQALGKKFASSLTEYTNVLRHISDLGSFRAVVKGLEVELDDFQTARPDPNEVNANAMATLTQKEQDAFRIRVRFRDNLTPSLFSKLLIDNSQYIQNHLNLVATDILNTQQENIKVNIVEEAKRLLNQWNSISQTIDSNKPEDIFPLLVLENESALRKADNTISYTAFQLLLTAGIRRFESRKIQKILILN